MAIFEMATGGSPAQPVDDLGTLLNANAAREKPS
jgi:hypothetical protein